MRKIILAVAMAFVATTASAAILGSSHDFSVAGSPYGAAAGGSDCAYCHMPHNSPVSVAGAPLWARNINYTTTYTFYTSTVNGHQPTPTSLNPGTRVCLSCHDGTQALAVVFKIEGGTQNLSTGASTIVLAAGPSRVGPNLTTDHPVSVLYTSTTAGNPFGLSGAPPSIFNITPGTSTIECTSCHNAHNAKGAAVCASYPNRQFMPVLATDFCGGCHSAK